MFISRNNVRLIDAGYYDQDGTFFRLSGETLDLSGAPENFVLRFSDGENPYTEIPVFSPAAIAAARLLYRIDD